jgi:hypothetical protein
MMYEAKLVAALKVDGKVLREQDGEVKIPFGTEYSLLLKNLSSRKAVVTVSIDGQDVLDGSKLILQPNAETNLEGIMKGSTVHNKFRFIERTEPIEAYRGTRVDDGMVRIEFWYEKEAPLVRDLVYRSYPWYDWDWYYWHPIHIEPWRPVITWGGDFSTGSAGNVCTAGGTTASYGSTMTTTPTAGTYTVNMNYTAGINDIGITVKGSKTQQNFQAGYTAELETVSHVIVLRLKGYKNNTTKIEKPLFVKEKVSCETCGKTNHSDAKYCSECGTFLD